ncbi:integrating conjugative element protein [Pseudomonas sp. PA15(2017)]|uniref:integrating conjugative element protein n=1 Tax=Pseudomonas sp. PA15(2017) TaxID=1932111 RepID=UPI00096673E7|nr:integrating conjugative element protein [Pseudomonas sp. PA15(2017)]OLU25514.1 integrating conjugative element protein [Pseudomonas sp. PA15(2017)]
MTYLLQLRRLLYGLAILLALPHLPASAAGISDLDISSLSDRIYYQIGGANVSTRSSSGVNTLGYGISANWSDLQMCGNLDLEGTVKNQLNGVTDGFKNMMSGVLQQATAAVTSLPALILKRSNPDLYDLINNGVLQARVDFDKGLLSCQRMTETMGDVLNGGGWQQAATATSWADAISSTGGDAAASEQRVSKEAGNRGLLWTDGQSRGGHNQPAIAVTRDTVIAGYNILNGRANTSDTSSVSSSSCTGELCRQWPTPNEAAQFMKRVVGEQEIRTCDNCEQSRNTPGVGLMPIIQEEQEEIYTALQDLVTQRVPTTAENLNKASGGSMRTSRSVIEALQRDPDSEVLMQRLSGEMALVRVLEQAISASRAMHAGMKEPNIANVNEAVVTNDRSLSMLEREINLIKTELDLRNSISNNTAMAILERRTGRQESGKPVDMHDPAINRPAQADKPRSGQ